MKPCNLVNVTPWGEKYVLGVNPSLFEDEKTAFLFFGLLFRHTYIRFEYLDGSSVAPGRYRSPNSPSVTVKALAEPPFPEEGSVKNTQYVLGHILWWLDEKPAPKEFEIESPDFGWVYLTIDKKKIASVEVSASKRVVEKGKFKKDNTPLDLLECLRKVEL